MLSNNENEKLTQAKKVELIRIQDELNIALIKEYENNRKFDFKSIENRNTVILKVISENKSTNYTDEYLYYYLVERYEKSANKIMKRQKQESYIDDEKLAELDAHWTNKNIGHKVTGTRGIGGYLLGLFFK